MIDLKSIDKEISELMQKPMTPGNIDLLGKLRQARKCAMERCDELDDDEARKWAATMNPGAKWSQEQTAAVMRQRGYDHKLMNVMYSDFGKVAQKHNVDKPEFFADLADAFLTDPDAQKGKLARYYRDIVQH